jgi:hypothetical protein
LVRSIAGERAQVADMIGEALELERDSTNCLAARRFVTACEGLDGAAECARMSDDGIAGNGLGDENRSAALRALEQPLDATVLIAKHYFQRKNLFAVRLESKMTGLDDTGVYGANSDLVHFIAVDDVKRENFLLPRSESPPARCVIGRMSTQRLQRRMALRNRTALFGYLALEPRRLMARDRQRGIFLTNEGAGHAQLRTIIIGDDGADTQCLRILGHTKQRNDSPPGGDRGRQSRSKLLRFMYRYVGNVDTPSIVNAEERWSAHGAMPPSNCAARARESCRGVGM